MKIVQAVYPLSSMRVTTGVSDFGFFEIVEYSYADSEIYSG
jgi:hypothetical protein